MFHCACLFPKFRDCFVVIGWLGKKDTLLDYHFKEIGCWRIQRLCFILSFCYYHIIWCGETIDLSFTQLLQDCKYQDRSCIWLLHELNENTGTAAIYIQEAFWIMTCLVFIQLLQVQNHILKKCEDGKPLFTFKKSQIVFKKIKYWYGVA